jgi:4-amino-4-deoxy-L-arabinose transferase-like glycosyltransferase
LTVVAFWGNLETWLLGAPLEIHRGEAKLRADKRQNARWLILILLVALLFRLGYVLTLEPTINWNDGREYRRLALCIVENHSYLAPDGRPTAYWPPGYPMFLALFGTGVTSTRLLQALMGTLSILLAYLVARQFHGRKKSFLAAAILAIYPLHVFVAGVHSSVVLQILLVIAVFQLVTSALKDGSKPKAFLAGLFGGVATLTTISILPALCLTLVWFVYEDRTRRGFRLAILFFLPLSIVVGSWTVRNYIRLGAPILVSSNGGYNFWLGNYPGTKATTGNRKIEGRVRETAEIDAAYPDEAERDHAYFRLAFDKIRANPGRFLTLSASKALNLWRLYPTPASMPLDLKKKLFSILSYGLLLPFCFYWLLSNLRRHRGARLVFLFFLAYTLLHAFFISKVRYRLPLDTLVVVMAVGGLGDLARKLGWKVLEDNQK